MTKGDEEERPGRMPGALRAAVGREEPPWTVEEEAMGGTVKD